jgi:Ca2+-binding RTX toxin-like protein
MISGGLGQDTLDGGLGNDTISYADMNDSLLGVTIDLSAGKSSGAAGNDSLTGFEGVQGGAGDDSLLGDDRANFLHGGSGANTLSGGVGNDTLLTSGPLNLGSILTGGLGDDSLVATAIDHWAAYSDATGAVTVDLSLGRAYGAAGNDSLVISRAFGSDYNDCLIGSVSTNLDSPGGQNTLDGRAGDDWIDGGYGRDSLIGGLGNDTLLGGFALSIWDGRYQNVLRGDQGNDSLFGGTDSADWAGYSAANGAVTVDLIAGTTAGADGADSLTGIEHALGGIGADSILGDSQANELAGGLGNDTLIGGLGADTISYTDMQGADQGVTVDLNAGTSAGAAGADSFLGFEGARGGVGNDSLLGDSLGNILAGGVGSDTLTGGAGDDTLIGNADIDWVNYAAASGAVTIDLGAGTSAGAAGNDSLQAIEVALGGNGNDQLAGSNSVSFETFFGGAGNDTFFGSVGWDSLSGDEGSDLVSFARLDGTVTIDLSAGIATVARNISLQPGEISVAYDGRLNVWNQSTLFTDWGAAQTFFLNRGGNLAAINDRTEQELIYHNAGINEGWLGGTDAEQEGVWRWANGDTFNYFWSSTYPSGQDYFNNVGDSEHVFDMVYWNYGWNDIWTYGANEAVGEFIILSTSTLAGIENAVGSAGHDFLLGNDLANLLSGGAGNDSLAGGNGADTLNGGLGNDTMSGGDGPDIVSYADAAGAVTVNLADGTSSGFDGIDSLVGFEGIQGGSGNDSLLGDSAANTLDGGAGDDWLNFGGGAEVHTLSLGGNDTLDGGDGADTLDLGVGWTDGNVVDGFNTWSDGTRTIYERNWETVICFAEGTRIVTPNGEVPVEALRAGDMVLAMRDGYAGFEALRWVGSMDIAVPRDAVAAAKSAPILIKAGALAPGVPTRDLRVSPDHAMEVDGHLIPAKHLVNGSIIQEIWRRRVRYFHLELDTHGLLLSDGAWSESYLDDGSRRYFDNVALTRLYLDFEANRSKGQYDDRACLPVLRKGLKLDMILGRIALRAEELARGAKHYASSKRRRRQA